MSTSRRQKRLQLAIVWAASAAVILVSSVATAAPPVATQAANDDAITLRMEGRNLKYSYDLSRVFDKALWRVLEDYGFSDFTVEVRLLDQADKVRTTHYHTLKIELLDQGRVRVMTSKRRGKVYETRAAMLRALTRVPGKAIRAKDFGSTEGHLELTVLVNPVQVYSFPDHDAPLADQKVVPKTYYDRKVELRSRAVQP